MLREMQGKFKQDEQDLQDWNGKLKSDLILRILFILFELPSVRDREIYANLLPL